MHRTNIYLDDDQYEALGRLAGEEGRSRSEVIRNLIDRGLGHTDSGMDEDLAAIQQSFGTLQEVELEARGDDARSRHLDNVWRTR